MGEGARVEDETTCEIRLGTPPHPAPPLACEEWETFAMGEGEVVACSGESLSATPSIEWAGKLLTHPHSVCKRV